MNKNYIVGCGIAGIYAGELKKSLADGTLEWKDKTLVTDKAIEAVRDYMINDCLGGLNNPQLPIGGYSWKLKDGREVTLKVSIN